MSSARKLLCQRYIMRSLNPRAQGVASAAFPRRPTRLAVSLAAGDMVPGDLRLLSCKDLLVSQALLTGEPTPVKKTTDFTPPDAAIGSASDLDNICLMGTKVVSGTASAVVLATGERSYFGSVARGSKGERPSGT